MKKRNKPQIARDPRSSTDENETANAEPLVGLQPTNPPRKNVLFLAISATAFLLWFVFLCWLALNR